MIFKCLASGIRITGILLAFAQGGSDRIPRCGCGRTDAGEPDRGELSVALINGSSLPYVVPQSPHAFVIDSALIELGNGGTYVEQMWGQPSSDITIGISAPKVNDLILFDQGTYGMSSDAEVALEAFAVAFASDA